MNYILDKFASNTADRLVNNMIQPNQMQQISHPNNNIKNINKDDSFSIDSFTKKTSTSNTTSPTNIKLILILFLIFIFISSNIFTNTILSCFGNQAVKGRDPTAIGVIIQGIFLIIFYILFATLIKKGVI